MKTARFLVPLTLAVLSVTPRLQAQTIIAGPGGTYANPFASEPPVTFDPAPSGNPLLSLVLDNTGSTGPITEGIWTMNAQGGSNVSILWRHDRDSRAHKWLSQELSCSLTGTIAPTGSLLGLLGTSTNLTYAWTATAAFGSVNYQANSQYNLSFQCRRPRWPAPGPSPG